MISRSDWEPLASAHAHPEPLPLFCACAPGYLSPCRFFHCRRVVCACSAGAALVHSLINHFRPIFNLINIIHIPFSFQKGERCSVDVNRAQHARVRAARLYSAQTSTAPPLDTVGLR